MSRRARAALLLLAFAALAAALVWRADTRSHHRRSEARSVAIVEELVAGGPWLAPTLHGRVRLQKPPLYHWLAAGMARVSGTPPLATLRGVSVVSALALVALVYGWGASLGGFRAGFASALALAATTQLWASATLGTADMLLAAFTTAALLAFERRRLPALAALFALAFLTKATAALVNVLVPIGAWLIVERQLARAVKPRTLVWICGAAVASLAWYVAVLALVPDAGARLREFFFVPLGAGHSDLASDHYRPSWWYLPRLLWVLAPAVVLLPWLARDAVRTHFFRDQPRVRFLATSALALLVAWSLVPQKGQHYLLPIAPLYALSCGEWLARRGARPTI